MRYCRLERDLFPPFHPGEARKARAVRIGAQELAHVEPDQILRLAAVPEDVMVVGVATYVLRIEERYESGYGVAGQLPVVAVTLRDALIIHEYRSR